LLLIMAAGIGGFMIGKNQNKPTTATAASTQPENDTKPSDQPSIFQGQQDRAKDSKRKTDINALHAQIEAYYSQSGNYPTFANMNDRNFRLANLKGLDEEALKDPDGTDAVLVRIPAPHIYAYDVAAEDGTACDNLKKDCAAYSLIATLSDGSNYTKKALN
jgi:type II secretory pathway pseudopilin PulG